MNTRMAVALNPAEPSPLLDVLRRRLDEDARYHADEAPVVDTTVPFSFTVAPEDRRPARPYRWDRPWTPVPSHFAYRHRDGRVVSLADVAQLERGLGHRVRPRRPRR